MENIKNRCSQTFITVSHVIWSLYANKKILQNISRKIHSIWMHARTLMNLS